MKTISFAILLAAAMCRPAAADDDCMAPSPRAIASIEQLPPAVQALLGRDEPGVGGIADAGARFNPSDVAFGNPSLPMRRFASASEGNGCFAVTVEQGGIAHRFETHIVRKDGRDWRLAGTRRPELSELPAQHAKQRQP